MPTLISHVMLVCDVIYITEPQQCLLGIQSQTSSIFCCFLSNFLSCKLYPSSSIHWPFQTSNIQPIETTLSSSYANLSVTVANTPIVYKASDVNIFSMLISALVRR